MKQTNLTGYGTIGCRIELNHSDMVALGVEVDVIKDFLRSLRNDPETKTTLQEITAINRIVFFLEKFAIIPSETNIFTDTTSAWTDKLCFGLDYRPIYGYTIAVSFDTLKDIKL